MKPQRTALVTGSTERLKAVKPALERGGFEVNALDRLERLGERCAALGTRCLDAYVQLPVEVSVDAGTMPQRLGDFLSGGLLARFQAAAAVLPALRSDATVVLVAGHRPGDDDIPDDPHARFDLLRILAEAVRSESLGVRAVVVGSSCSPHEIAAVAAKQDEVQTGKLLEYAAYGPELSYADWKQDILSLTAPQDWERTISAAKGPVRYVGWLKPNGDPAVVAVRGAVVTPLPLTAPTPRVGLSSEPLARTLLQDALRPHPPTQDCCAEPTSCPGCAQAARAADALCEAFVAEILGVRPVEEFTLAAHTIRAWARPRLGDPLDRSSPPPVKSSSNRGARGPA